jgi:hypothetical protein
MTMRLSDDWQGADFIAQRIDGGTFLKVELRRNGLIQRHSLMTPVYSVSSIASTCWLALRNGLWPATSEPRW